MPTNASVLYRNALQYGVYTMAILGLSGSPFVRGNTDRLVKAVLKKSNKETVFVNLSKLTFNPCRVVVVIFVLQQIYVVEKMNFIHI